MAVGAILEASSYPQFQFAPTRQLHATLRAQKRLLEKRKDASETELGQSLDAESLEEYLNAWSTFDDEMGDVSERFEKIQVRMEHYQSKPCTAEAAVQQDLFSIDSEAHKTTAKGIEMWASLAQPLSE